MPYALCPMPYAHEYLIFLKKAIFQCRIPHSSNPLPLSPSGPLPLGHNRQSRMQQQLNGSHPKNLWVEEAQKPSTGYAPPTAASTLL